MFIYTLKLIKYRFYMYSTVLFYEIKYFYVLPGKFNEKKYLNK